MSYVTTAPAALSAAEGLPEYGEVRYLKARAYFLLKDDAAAERR